MKGFQNDACKKPDQPIKATWPQLNPIGHFNTVIENINLKTRLFHLYFQAMFHNFERPLKYLPRFPHRQNFISGPKKLLRKKVILKRQDS